MGLEGLVNADIPSWTPGLVAAEALGGLPPTHKTECSFVVLFKVFE